MAQPLNIMAGELFNPRRTGRALPASATSKASAKTVGKITQ